MNVKQPKVKVLQGFAPCIQWRVLLAVVLLLFCFQLGLSAQNQRTVTGVVKDEKGETLIGVSIQIKGTTQGTTSDLDGAFSISASENNILEFSYVGMETQEIKVGAKTVLNIIMQDNAMLLKETVVIGYGSAKKRDLTGSIASISAGDLVNRPASNPAANLQGKIAGVQVVNTGRAGQDPEIRIRGTNSLNGYKPLYVVDGLFTDNIGYINTSDIESMEILKDPSSLAIFGVAGANGVIIVSTKKAKRGETRVNLSSSLGWKHVGSRMHLTNAEQFKELYSEQLMNQSADPFDYTNWQADTDWQKEVFQIGFVTNNDISISGASEKNRFYLGVGYTSEEGSIKKEKFSKVTINLKSDYDVTSFLRFGFQFNGSRILPPDAKQVGPAVKAAPIAPTYYTYNNPTTGRSEVLPHAMPNFQSAQVWNPMIEVRERARHNKATNYRGNGNIYGELDIYKGLTFKTTFTLDYQSNQFRQAEPVAYVYNPDSGKKENLNDRDIIRQQKSTELKSIGDFILNYDNQFGKHGINGTFGITTRYNEFEMINAGRAQTLDEMNFPIGGTNKDYWWITSLGENRMTNTGEQWKQFTMSYLVRALYNYDNKYLLNGTYRRDGSSIFRGVGNTWDNFYSVGAGWIMSEENFMKNIPYLDYLKLKGSYGVLGSEAVPNNAKYPTYPGLDELDGAVWGDRYVPIFGMKYMVSPSLGWEKTYSWEAGLELQMFNQRLSIEPTYYNKRTKDIILLLPPRSGRQNSMVNDAEITNRGWELTATWRDKIGKSGFNYSLSANLTTINNKVQSYGSIDGDEYIDGNQVSRATVGSPVGYFYGYKVEGVYQNYEDIKQSKPNEVGSPKPGDLKFADVNGDGRITKDDRTNIGNPTPDFTYGVNVNMSFKGFDLGIDMMGVYGNEIYRKWDVNNYGQMNYNTDRLGRWHGAGTSNWEPILDPGRSLTQEASNYYVEDGSFFRIRNMQLGYTLNPNWLKKIHANSLRFFANVENLKTWGKNSGYTPEIGGNAVAFGVDNGTYPMPTVYTFGFNLSF